VLYFCRNGRYFQIINQIKSNTRTRTRTRTRDLRETRSTGGTAFLEYAQRGRVSYITGHAPGSARPCWNCVGMSIAVGQRLLTQKVCCSTKWVSTRWARQRTRIGAARGNVSSASPPCGSSWADVARAPSTGPTGIVVAKGQAGCCAVLTGLDGSRTGHHIAAISSCFAGAANVTKGAAGVSRVEAIGWHLAVRVMHAEASFSTPHSEAGVSTSHPEAAVITSHPKAGIAISTPHRSRPRRVASPGSVHFLLPDIVEWAVANASARARPAVPPMKRGHRSRRWAQYDDGVLPRALLPLLNRLLWHRAEELLPLCTRP
jgi:hypothetical protein